MEFFKRFLDYFSRIVTLILCFSSLYILFFWGADALINISYIWGVLALSAFCTFASLIFPLAARKGEISKLKMIFLQVVFFLVINVAVFITGFLCKWFSFEYKIMLIGMELVIIVVFILVNVISYIADSKTAKKMNERLTRH